MATSETSRFSRRTVVAAVDVLERMSQADFSRFLRTLGPLYRSRIRGEDFSLKKRLNDLIDILDDEPKARTDEGDLVADVVVERAASGLPDLHPWSGDEWAPFPVLRRALQMDGYTMVEGALRRSLPNDLHLPPGEGQASFMRLTACRIERFFRMKMPCRVRVDKTARLTMKHGRWL